MHLIKQSTQLSVCPADSAGSYRFPHKVAFFDIYGDSVPIIRTAYTFCGAFFIGAFLE